MKPDQLNGVMEFDHVIRVQPDGSVTDEPDVYAPELHNGELESPPGTSWSLLNGYSSQYGYSGPIMHPSEFIGGGMARDILAEPGVYVALVDYPIGDEFEDGEPDGWAVARMND